SGRSLGKTRTQGSPQGPAGQAPLLRRRDQPAGGPDPGHLNLHGRQRLGLRALLAATGDRRQLVQVIRSFLEKSLDSVRYFALLFRTIGGQGNQSLFRGNSMAIPQLNEEAIFNVARLIDGPEARRTYLGQACGEDPELRVRVDALLRVYDENRSFLQPPATG